MWRGQEQGQWVTIYAGAESSEPLEVVANVYDANGNASKWSQDIWQGIIVIYHEAGDKPTEIYQTPQRLGNVEIVSEANGLLTIKAADGSMVTFDIAKRAWVP